MHFKFKRDNYFISIFFSIIFMALLILTHTVTALCMAIILFLFWLTPRITNQYYRKKETLISHQTFIYFFVSMLAWWWFASKPLTSLVKVFEWGFSRERFMTDPGITLDYLVDVSIAEQVFKRGAKGARKGYNKIKIDLETWSGHILSAGVYFYLLIHDQKVLAKGKMAVIP